MKPTLRKFFGFFILFVSGLPIVCLSQQNKQDSIKGLQWNSILSILDFRNAQKHFDAIQRNVSQLIEKEKKSNSSDERRAFPIFSDRGDPKNTGETIGGKFEIAQKVVNSEEKPPNGGFSLRDQANFIWKYYFRRNDTPNEDEIKSVAEFLKEHSSIKEIMGSQNFSNHQKAEEIQRKTGYFSFGTVTTGSSEYSGVIKTLEGSNEIDIDLKAGGTTRIPRNEISEISLNNGQSIRCYIALKKNNGEILEGSVDQSFITGWVFNARFQKVTLSSTEIKRIAFGSRGSTKCKECFETLEIYWKYCPYCGKIVQ